MDASPSQSAEQQADGINLVVVRANIDEKTGQDMFQRPIQYHVFEILRVTDNWHGLGNLGSRFTDTAFSAATRRNIRNSV
jgi:hypothetical protein